MGTFGRPIPQFFPKYGQLLSYLGNTFWKPQQKIFRHRVHSKLTTWVSVQVCRD